MPPDQKRSHRASTFERMAAVSIDSSLLSADPAGAPALALRRDRALVAKLAQDHPDHDAAYPRAIGFDVRDRERTHAPLDRVADLLGLRPPAHGQRAHPLLELAVGTQHHAPGVVEP